MVCTAAQAGHRDRHRRSLVAGVELVALRASCDSDPFGIHELGWAVVEPKAHEALAERLAGWQERYSDVRVRRVVVFDRPPHHLIEQAETAQLVVVGTPPPW